MIFLISFSEMRNALPQQAGRRTTHIGWWASGNAAQPTNPLPPNIRTVFILTSFILTQPLSLSEPLPQFQFCHHDYRYYQQNRQKRDHADIICNHTLMI